MPCTMDPPRRVSIRAPPMSARCNVTSQTHVLSLSLSLSLVLSHSLTLSLSRSLARSLCLYNKPKRDVDLMTATKQREMRPDDHLPFLSARSNAVNPSSSVALTSALASSSAATTSPCPLPAANINAVFPRFCVAFTFVARQMRVIMVQGIRYKNNAIGEGTTTIYTA